MRKLEEVYQVFYTNKDRHVFLQGLDSLPKEYRRIKEFFVELEHKEKRATLDIAVQHRDNGSLLKLNYENYRKTKLWKKISRRVLKRDERICRRCDGKATEVHHRAYSVDVMLGEDDSQLVSICRGCHQFIGFNDFGKKRSAEEADRLLEEKYDGKFFPQPKIDLRKRFGQIPPEWERMSDIQRRGWENEYSRLWLVGKLKLLNDPKLVDLNRKYLYHYGMDDSAIDAALTTRYRKPYQMNMRRTPAESPPSNSVQLMRKKSTILKDMKQKILQLFTESRMRLSMASAAAWSSVSVMSKMTWVAPIEMGRT